MKNIEDGSLAINHGNIEYLYVFIKNKDNLENFTKKYRNNNFINIEDYIDLNEFKNIFKYKPKTLKVHGRAWEATERFIISVKEYYKIDILKLSDKGLISFLNSYVKEFNEVEDYFKLNVYHWKNRSLEQKKTALNSLKTKLNKINELSIV